jgi:diadenosine tetraphosphate (Ap4A) HIT family hydrolase
MNQSCPFCFLPADRVVVENGSAVAIFDGFPVTLGHGLVIPRRHAETFFDLTEAEVADSMALVFEMRRWLLADDDSITGFNIGINAGADAGQTVFHCHIHLIPRRAGDVAAPRGGVRNIIPGRGDY